MTDGTVTPETANAPTTAVPPNVLTPSTLTDLQKIQALLTSPATQADIAAVETDIDKIMPAKARSFIYSAGKWIGIAAAAALSSAGIFTGNTELYITAGAGIALALSSALAKANVPAAPASK